jgi:opacity protein-like surface antigen
MNSIKSILIASAVLLPAIPAIAGTTIPSLAENQPVATSESGWHVRAALYGWATALDGDVTLRGNNVPVDVGFDEVWEKLDFAAMGVVEIGKGRWGFLADLFYAELGADNAKRNLVFDAQLDQFIGNFVITCNVIDDPRTRFDVYAGARVNSLDMDLNITRTGVILTRTFSGSDSKTWVDPIIGVRYQQGLSDRFFFRAVGDIGGFGVSSDLTWQALAGLGYHINDDAAVVLGYRGIGTDYEDGDFGYDVISHGILLGLEYRF